MSEKRVKKRRKKLPEEDKLERHIVYEADVDKNLATHEFIMHLLLLTLEDADVTFDKDGQPVKMVIDFDEDSQKAFNYLRGSLRSYKDLVRKLNPYHSWPEVMTDLKNILRNYEERLKIAKEKRENMT